jgi:alpha-beta hydrolase superfamily lysophospholipase
MSDQTAALDEQAFDFDGVGGVRIAGYRWSGGPPARMVVQLAHGMAEHARRYRPVVQRLAEAGAVVYANDHRGHGRTAPSVEALGDFGPGGYDAMPEDMAVLTRRARAERPGLPVILIGHSMGSFAAQAYVLEHSDLIDGLVLSGSTALDELVKSRASFATLNASFEPARTPFDWLSRDEAQVDAYIADPYCGFPAKAEQVRSPDMAQRLADPEQLRRIDPDLPINLLAGDEDPLNGRLAHLHTLAERYRAAGIKDVSCDFYPGGRHEMFNETNRDEVISKLLAWIDRVVAARAFPTSVGSGEVG